MTQPNSLDPLRLALEAQVHSRPVAVRSPDCLDEDTVAALAEGTLEGEPRTAALAHLAACAHCRAAAVSVFRALRDPEVARELSDLKRSRRVRFIQIAAPLAAAAIVLVLVWPGDTRDRQAPAMHRGPTITAAPGPVPLWPLGAVTSPRLLRWGTVLGADLYRVTLFDSGGGVRFEAQLPDTVATLPDSVMLAPGRYLWRVEARTGWGRWSASELVEFSIAAGAAQ